MTNVFCHKDKEACISLDICRHRIEKIEKNISIYILNYFEAETRFVEGLVSEGIRKRISLFLNMNDVLVGAKREIENGKHVLLLKRTF